MRVYWIDLLRFLSSMLIITIHACSGYWSQYGKIPDIDWHFINILMSFALSFGVPIFVMISGYVILGKPMISEKFYSSMAKRLLPAFVFWSIFYSLFCYMFIDQDMKNLIWRVSAGLILTGKSYFHLWYLSMLICLMTVTPFLNKFIRGETLNYKDLKTLFIIICAFMTFNSVSYLKMVWTGTDFSWYKLFALHAIYFMAGYYIGTQTDKITATTKKLCSIYFSIFVLSVFLNYMAVKYHFVDDNLVLGAHGIFAFALSTILFLIFSRYNPTRESSRSMVNLSELALGIYLIHPFILYFVQKQIRMQVSCISLAVLLTIFLTAMGSIVTIIIARKTYIGKLIT